MHDLILHHFDSSPFSEKIRLIFGFKKLRWKSVSVPMILPKPDVVALTGGYRRTPFLQLGADIYCDTALMCRVIDRLAPEPPLYLTGGAASGMQHLLAQWADSALFWTAIPYTTQPAGIPYVLGDVTPEFLKAMAQDRAAMTAGMRRVTTTDAAAQLHSYFTWLESLVAGGGFLLGDRPCIADFSVAQSLWFILRVPPVVGVVAPFKTLVAWYERVVAFEHGHAEPLDSGDAIAIAARATDRAPTQVEPGLGFDAGAQVTVAPTDYAADLVTGTLVGLSASEVVIERRDDRAGAVHVHFPRIGYQIKRAG
jgi:glutathione S-transferase